MRPRAELVERVIRPALDTGKVVVADRYEASSFVYQGVLKGLNVDHITRITSYATGALHPDLTFLIVVPSYEMKERLANGQEDRFDSMSLADQELVQAGYLNLMRIRRSWHVLDGTLPREELADQVWEIVSVTMKEKKT